MMSLRASATGALMLAAAAAWVAPASAANIVELWDQAKAPAAPKLSPVTVKAKTTALLILDFVKRICNEKSRPRCVAAAPAVGAFLAKARAAGMPVIYSNTPGGTKETILPPVKAMANDALVDSHADKFLGTRLAAILKGKRVDTVVLCGTTAVGAALFTGAGAAGRGYKVVLPVDCVPGSSLYEEQAAVWILTNGPASRRKTTATTLGQITIE